MDAIDYAEANCDLMVWGSLMAMGMGGIFAFTWWLGQAQRFVPAPKD